jgi:hypothetical protein
MGEIQDYNYNRRCVICGKESCDEIVFDHYGVYLNVFTCTEHMERVRLKHIIIKKALDMFRAVLLDKQGVTEPRPKECIKCIHQELKTLCSTCVQKNKFSYKIENPFKSESEV